MKEGVWFKRILWSFIPITKEGYAITSIAIVAGLVIIFLIEAVKKYGYLGPEADALQVITLLIVVATLIVIARRHS